MSKRKSKHHETIPYFTFGRFVHLGPHTPRKTRINAIKAGLTPITAKHLRTLLQGNMAIQRMAGEGEWSDTVRYDAPIWIPR